MLRWVGSIGASRVKLWLEARLHEQGSERECTAGWAGMHRPAGGAPAAPSVRQSAHSQGTRSLIHPPHPPTCPGCGGTGSGAAPAAAPRRPPRRRRCSPGGSQPRCSARRAAAAPAPAPLWPAQRVAGASRWFFIAHLICNSTWLIAACHLNQNNCLSLRDMAARANCYKSTPQRKSPHLVVCHARLVKLLRPLLDCRRLAAHLRHAAARRQQGALDRMRWQHAAGQCAQWTAGMVRQQRSCPS